MSKSFDDNIFHDKGNKDDGIHVTLLILTVIFVSVIVHMCV